jgi:phosphoribosyl 1,2-cyclic phosphate phosphodiesterase
LRSSGLIQTQERQILIDAGPDFRTQALKSSIDKLSAVLLTHAHADHIAGMDDLRAYYFLTKKKLPCILSQETFDEVKLRYHYMLKEVSLTKSVSAQIDFEILSQDGGTFSIEGIPFSYFSYYQQGTKVTGFRLGNFAYVTDIKEYSESVIEALKGVKTLVVSAMRQNPTQMHFSLDEAVSFSKRVCAKQTFLTHISHELEHKSTNRSLPSDVQLSYDGLEFAFDY